MLFDSYLLSSEIDYDSKNFIVFAEPIIFYTPLSSCIMVWRSCLKRFYVKVFYLSKFIVEAVYVFLKMSENKKS